MNQYADKLAEEGDTLRLSGRHDQAFAHYSKVLKIDPNNYQALKGIGNVYIFKEDYDTAISYLKKAEDIGPLDPRIHQSLGWSYFHLGMYEAALEEFQLAQLLWPHSVDIYIGRGACHRKLEQYQTALETYDSALEHDALNHDIMVAKYETYLEMKAFEELIGFTERWIALTEEDHLTLSYLAQAHILSGDLEKAKLSAEKAMYLRDDYHLSHAVLGLYYLRSDMPSQALTYFKEALSLDNSSELALASIGPAYFLLGDYPNARVALLYSINAQEVRLGCFSYVALAVIENDKGEEALARSYLEQALELDSDCPFVTVYHDLLPGS
jgi:tetratricopeptide (TPR) repeat protein